MNDRICLEVVDIVCNDDGEATRHSGKKILIYTEPQTPQPSFKAIITGPRHSAIFPKTRKRKKGQK